MLGKQTTTGAFPVTGPVHNYELLVRLCSHVRSRLYDCIAVTFTIVALCAWASSPFIGIIFLLLDIHDIVLVFLLVLRLRCDYN